MLHILLQAFYFVSPCRNCIQGLLISEPCAGLWKTIPLAPSAQNKHYLHAWCVSSGKTACQAANSELPPPGSGPATCHSRCRGELSPSCPLDAQNEHGADPEPAKVPLQVAGSWNGPAWGHSIWPGKAGSWVLSLPGPWVAYGQGGECFGGGNTLFIKPASPALT